METKFLLNTTSNCFHELIKMTFLGRSLEFVVIVHKTAGILISSVGYECEFVFYLKFIGETTRREEIDVRDAF